MPCSKINPLQDWPVITIFYPKGPSPWKECPLSLRPWQVCLWVLLTTRFSLCRTCRHRHHRLKSKQVSWRVPWNRREEKLKEAMALLPKTSLASRINRRIFIRKISAQWEYRVRSLKILISKTSCTAQMLWVLENTSPRSKTFYPEPQQSVLVKFLAIIKATPHSGKKKWKSTLEWSQAIAKLALSRKIKTKAQCNRLKNKWSKNQASCSNLPQSEQYKLTSRCQGLLTTTPSHSIFWKETSVDQSCRGLDQLEIRMELLGQRWMFTLMSWSTKICLQVLPRLLYSQMLVLKTANAPSLEWGSMDSTW